MQESPSVGCGATDERSDTELIDAINGGDSAAFEVLYFRHRDWVAGQAFRFTADQVLALDVLQETFIYLLRKFPGFILRARLRTFLYPAIRHLALAAREKAVRCQGAPEHLDSLAGRTAEAPDPGRHEALTAVLALLAAEHREVLRLRFVEGFKLDEIAAALAVPLGTVKSRLHHALRTLRQDPRTREYLAP